MSAITMSPDQRNAHDAIVDWWKARKRQLMTVGGLAGTGKSTLLSIVTDHMKVGRKKRRRARIGFACYTGKASLVLRNKLDVTGVLRAHDTCGTIHGLIYKPVKENGVITGWKKKADGEIECEMFVIDEGSMIDEKLFKDLESYGLPILVVGDHGQLPPISGQLNLMASPDVRLEKIHRQAEGNPIIKLSMMARNGEPIPPGSYGDFVNKVTDRSVLDRVNDPADMMVLCGTNKTRQQLNQQIRRRLGFTAVDPMVGEKLMCLRNDHKKVVFNGQAGRIIAIKEHQEHWFNVRISLDDGGVFEDLVVRRQFGATKTLNMTDAENKGPLEKGGLWDFGYAQSVHKSQGSQARRVVLFDEVWWLETEEMRNRWRYTGITRSSERLLIVGH